MFWLRNKKNNFQLRTLIWSMSLPTSATFVVFWLRLQSVLEPDQAQQNVKSDEDPNYLTLVRKY